MTTDSNTIKNLKDLKKYSSHQTVLIIGGGIVGAGLYRDLCLNGVKATIIDKGDFAGKTSQWSSKMLHGGVRYLETFEFSLVKEALTEKNLWLKIAPHLCYENRFFLPVYKENKNPLWKIRLGLWLYDLLSAFRNSPHESLNKSNTIKEVPGLRSEGLTGAGVYYDAIVDDAKLTLECIYDGSIESQGNALTHIEYLSHEKIDDLYHIKLKDNLTGEIEYLTSDYLIFALGPYTDQVLGSKISNWKQKMLPSKGIHLWVSPQTLPVSHPLLLPLNDGRVMFVIPQKQMILIGTTETQPKSIDDTNTTNDEIEYVKNSIKDFFPNHPIKDEHILGTYAGIRPLVRDSDSNDLGKTSREHKVFQIEKRLYSIAGGKLTTFRIMGSEITKDICTDLNLPYNPDLTMQPLRKRSKVLPFEKNTITNRDIEEIIETEFVRTKDDLLERRLGVINSNGFPFTKDLNVIDIDQYFI